MYFFLQVAASGIATGAIYGLIAVGYSLTFMTTKALNFALGMWVMLGGMLTYSLIVLHGVHPLFVLPAVIVALFLLGLVAERLERCVPYGAMKLSKAALDSLIKQCRDLCSVKDVRSLLNCLMVRKT